MPRTTPRTPCSIVPPHLLMRLAALQDARYAVAADAARHALRELDPPDRKSVV